MKILCLYSNQCALELFEWIEKQGNEIVLKTERFTEKWCREQKFDLAISYTYPFIIQAEIIEVLNGNIINLHNSYLPFDKGTSPNLWNILEETPRGVSIHFIDKGLDTGDVIAQQLVELEESATLRTSYEQLDWTVKSLFKKIFPVYQHWDSMRKKCIGSGTYHRESDFDIILDSFEKWSWDLPVKEYKQRAREIIKNQKWKKEKESMLKNHLIIVFGMEHYNPLGLIRTLGKCGVYPVYIAIKGRGVASSKSKYIKKVHYVDTVEQGYEVLLKEYSDLAQKPFILTTDDDVQSILDIHYSELKDKFIMYNAGTDGRVTKYMDKKCILDIAEKYGLKVLPTVVVDKGEIPENLEYPVITKAMSPTEADWKKNVFICESEAELKKAFEQIACSKVLIQKFIEKKNELCLDGFTIDKGHKSFIPMGTNYNYLIRGYYSPYMTAFNFEDKELLEALNGMLSEIGFEGIFSIEFIIDQDDTCYFSEVNFRNSTWNYIATYIDMPIPVLWCEAMLTGKIEKEWNKQFPANFTAMTEPIDYKIRVEGGLIDFAQWLIDFKTTNVPFYLDKEDPEPFKAMVDNWRAFS